MYLDLTGLFMPAVKTPSIPTIERPGTGGRGPIDKLPTGGGDSWNDLPGNRRGPRERLTRYRLGLLVMLVASLILFLSLASAFFVRKDSGTYNLATNIYQSDWKPLRLPALLWLNTLILLLGSATMEMGRREVFREPAATEEWLGLGNGTIRRSLPWLGMSMILGAGFLAGQLVAWNDLYHQGVYFDSNPSSHFYYMLTGLHGLHLAGGMVALAWAGFSAVIGRRLESRQIVVDVTAWYWHAMAVVWLGIFALLKFFQ